MITNHTKPKVEILFEKESYDLVGCAYSVFNRLKYGYHEKYYQRAYAVELDEKKYKYVREQKVVISYMGKSIGRYFLDFLVGNQIVVELKVARDFYSKHVKQVLAYLKATNKRLGIIILFTPQGIKYKRVVN